MGNVEKPIICKLFSYPKIWSYHYSVSKNYICISYIPYIPAHPPLCRPMWSGKLNVAVQPSPDLVVIRLVLTRQNAMSDEEIQHQDRAVRLELAGCQGLLYLFYGPEVEFLWFRLVVSFDTLLFMCFDDSTARKRELGKQGNILRLLRRRA